MKDIPKWAHGWEYWGLALGSDERYKPRWYERRAYHMGLRDAARIVERERWAVSVASTPRKLGRAIIQAIHFYAYRLLGYKLPSEQMPPGV